MTESYRKMLFDNPIYRFSNISKFLGEVSIDHVMAKANLKEVEGNLDAFSVAVDQLGMDVSGIEGCLEDLKYAMKRLRQFIESPTPSGLTDKDACIFVDYMFHRYEELAKMASDLDKELMT